MTPRGELRCSPCGAGHSNLVYRLLSTIYSRQVGDHLRIDVVDPPVNADEHGLVKSLARPARARESLATPTTRRLKASMTTLESFGWFVRNRSFGRAIGRTFPGDGTGECVGTAQGTDRHGCVQPASWLAHTSPGLGSRGRLDARSLVATGAGRLAVLDSCVRCRPHRPHAVRPAGSRSVGGPVRGHGLRSAGGVYGHVARRLRG
jgi:hypothetical protein